jgi:cysteinyl-tRNA synthetase
MALVLYNTLARQKEAFTPAVPGQVTMYVCGPTVYSFPHIGNARPAVVFDTLARLLRTRYRVTYARNITDVDDKINRAAAAEGVDIDTIATRYAAIYHEDMAALGVAPPDIEPRATAHIPAMLDMIGRLVAAGHAYVADGHVLFRVQSFPRYGELSRRDRRELLAGARVEVAPYKEDPGDFVLWKPSAPPLPGWDSPWGRGRPGWHIECSAMAEQHLGRTIDIHGGGNDLIFPHHENELAQSTCAHGGETFARFWLHNGFVNVDHTKMSKSLGNVLLVRELLKQAPGEAIRLALLSGHYRQPLDWTGDVLPDAMRKLDRLYQTLRDLPEDAGAPGAPDPGFIAALEDDLNTPKALAVLFELARDLNRGSPGPAQLELAGRLRSSAALLGILRMSPAEWFNRGSGDALDAEQVEALIVARREARARRDFAAADRLRDELVRGGIVIEDGPEGTRWRRAG